MDISQDILKACIKGHEKAHFELYRLCYNTLMKMTTRYHADQQEAVSVMNLCFHKIVTNLSKYSSDIPFEPWFKKVAINTIIDEYRKNRKHKMYVQYVDQSSNFPEYGHDFNAAECQLNVDQLYKLIAELPEVHGKVFNLFAIDGYAHADIAQLLGLSEGTSKWYLNQARKILQEKIINQQVVSRNINPENSAVKLKPI